MLSKTLEPPYLAFLTLTLTWNLLLSHSRPWNSLTTSNENSHSASLLLCLHVITASRTSTLFLFACPFSPLGLHFVRSATTHYNIHHSWCDATPDLHTAAPPLDLAIAHSISDSQHLIDVIKDNSRRTSSFIFCLYYASMTTNTNSLKL